MTSRGRFAAPLARVVCVDPVYRAVDFHEPATVRVALHVPALVRRARVYRVILHAVADETLPAGHIAQNISGCGGAASGARAPHAAHAAARSPSIGPADSRIEKYQPPDASGADGRARRACAPSSGSSACNSRPPMSSERKSSDAARSSDGPSAVLGISLCAAHASTWRAVAPDREYTTLPGPQARAAALSASRSSLGATVAPGAAARSAAMPTNVGASVRAIATATLARIHDGSASTAST